MKKERRRQRGDVEDSQKKIRPVVIPYSHKAAHNLKHVAVKYKVPVVFSAPRKLSSLCRKINAENDKKKVCHTKHANPFVQCVVGVVYSILLTCGKIYIGQTGRCINDRLREHKLSLKNGTGSNLPLHCKECRKEENKTCETRLQDTSIVSKINNTIARELIEAHRIRKNGTTCVNTPSIMIRRKE